MSDANGSTGRRGLLLVAHGSRRVAANAQVLRLAGDLRGRLAGDHFAKVQAGFLELAQPLIADVVAEMVEAQVDVIVMLPYFLAAGRHVQQDIPQVCAALRHRYPQLGFEIRDHLGAAPAMADWLARLARD